MMLWLCRKGLGLALSPHSGLRLASHPFVRASLHHGSQSFVVRRTLEEFELLCDPVHHSCLVCAGGGIIGAGAFAAMRPYLVQIGVDHDLESPVVVESVSHSRRRGDSSFLDMLRHAVSGLKPQVDASFESRSQFERDFFLEKEFES